MQYFHNLMRNSRRSFCRMKPERKIFACSQKLVAQDVRIGRYENNMKIFQQIEEGLAIPDKSTFIRVVNACAGLRRLKEGRLIHLQIIQSGYECDVYVGSSLVDMYTKCGSIEDAWRVFKKMPNRNVVTWSSIILGHVKCGQGHKALDLFREMQLEGVQPGPQTFVGVLNACASLGSLEKGRHIHEQAIQTGYESNIFVGSSLIDMYTKCGNIDDAWRIFSKMPLHDVVTWSAMILGYVKCGQAQKALDLSRQMQREGVEPVTVTFVGMLNACSSLAALEEGRLVHKRIALRGCESDVFVRSSLINMYCNCGSIEEAWIVFNKMPICNVVSWNAMILGYVKCGQGKKALELYADMQRQGVAPVSTTFVGLLRACACVAALEEGRCIHEQIIQSGYESDIFVGSSLVDMYAKCGTIEDAKRVFHKMPKRDLVAWSGMLAAYALHGHGEEALKHFTHMCQEGLEMDAVTFVSLLSACSHAGLVDEGLHFFNCMSSIYCISPTMEHYVCMVDILGRVGRLHEAEDLVMKVACAQEVSVLRALLGACRIHGNVEMGEVFAKAILKLDPTYAAGYLLLANLYAAAGEWASSANIQQQRLEWGVKEHPDCTIEVNNEIHSFEVDDQKHAEIIEIRAILETLAEKMEEVGYVPVISFALGQEDKLSLFHPQ